MREGEVAAGEKTTEETLDPDLIRQDLQENINRHAFILMTTEKMPWQNGLLAVAVCRERTLAN
jgi:hypothetical protein